MSDKIYLIIKSPTGGAWSLAQKIAALWTQKGYDIEIVSFLNQEIPKILGVRTSSVLFDKFKGKKIPKILLPILSIGLMVQWFYKMRPKKIISVGFPISVPIALLNVKGCKHCILADTHVSNHLKYKLKQKNSLVFCVISKITHSRFIYRWMMSRVTCVISLTPAMAKDLQNNFGLSNEKSIVIPPFINPDFFNVKRIEPTEKNIILYVGRLSDEKNIGDQLKAFQIILRERPNAKFIIVGDGSELSDLRKKAIMLGAEKSVIFEGVQTNISEYHIKASVQILSSHYEGFPLVLAEAQASGVPVVYYDDIHNPSGIVADGLSGFIAPQGDVKKFADLIVKALDYSWDYDAIQKSADYLSQDNVSKKYLDFIKDF